MQSLVAWTLALMAALPPGSGAPPSRFQADVDQFMRLGASERQAWLRGVLVERMEHAAKMVLSPSDIEQTRSFSSRVQDRVQAGSPVSPDGLINLLEKIERIEQAAVARLGRVYRIEVYSRFHSQPQELQRRLAAWRQVQTEWEASSHRDQQQRYVMGWLEGAIGCMRTDPTASLPEPPAFDGPISLTENRSQREEQAHIAPRAPQNEPVPNGSRIGSKAPTVAARVTAVPKIDPSILSGPGRNTIQLPERPTPVAAATLEATQHETPLLHGLTPTVSERGQPLPRPPEAGTHLARRPLAGNFPLPPTVGPANAPAASGYDWFTEDASRAGWIDLDELAVRIAGYNLALARLAGELQDNVVWSSDRLTVAMAELEDLAARRSDLFLYWDLIADDERQGVGQLRPADAAIKLLSAKIVAARRSYESAESARSDPPERFHSELDQLSRRLAHLATGRPSAHNQEN